MIIKSLSFGEGFGVRLKIVFLKYFQLITHVYYQDNYQTEKV
jgi:hypothetical protein